MPRSGVIAFALMLAGCRGEFEFPPQPRGNQSVVVVPPGEKIIPPTATTPEIIEEEPQCFQRARHFAGLVQRPCADVARETR